MRTGELLKQIEDFRQKLLEHRDLWRKSLAQPPQYPVKNVEALRAQSGTLSTMLARLRPYFVEMRPDWAMENRATGERWDALTAATGLDRIAPIKGSSMERVLPIMEQFIGRLQARDADEEMPAEKAPPIAGRKTPVEPVIELAGADAEPGVPERHRAVFAAPFDEKFRWIRKAASAACHQLDVEFWAIEELARSTEGIVEAVHYEIAQATFGLAVVSGLTPNVMYELGILHQASKPTVLISDKETIAKIPLDLHGRMAVVYDDAGKNESELATVVRDAATSVIALFEPTARAALATGLPAPILRTALSSAHIAFTAVDFDRLKTSAAKAVGRKYCEIQDVNDFCDGSVRGWKLRARCSGGSTMTVIIDLNGEIKRIDAS